VRNGVGDPGFGSGSSGPGSGGIGEIGKPGDLIQLAPLRHGHGGSTSPHPPPLSLPGPPPASSTPGGASNDGPGYSVMQVNSNGSRVVNGGYGSGVRDGERDREKVGVGGREGERGKKNPLSIGSIISEETG